MFCDPLPLQLLSKNHFFSIFWNGVDLPPSYLDNVFKYNVCVFLTPYSCGYLFVLHLFLLPFYLLVFVVLHLLFVWCLPLFVLTTFFLYCSLFVSVCPWLGCYLNLNLMLFLFGFLWAFSSLLPIILAHLLYIIPLPHLTHKWYLSAYNPVGYSSQAGPLWSIAYIFLFLKRIWLMEDIHFLLPSSFCFLQFSC